MPEPMNNSMDRFMATKAVGRVSFLNIAAETRAIMTRALMKDTEKRIEEFKNPFMANSRMERL